MGELLTPTDGDLNAMGRAYDRWFNRVSAVYLVSRNGKTVRIKKPKKGGENVDA